MGRVRREMWIFDGSKVVGPAVSIEDCIIVELLSKYLNSTDRMLALMDPVNQVARRS
jgi:hypothetical protein